MVLIRSPCLGVSFPRREQTRKGLVPFSSTSILPRGEFVGHYKPRAYLVQSGRCVSIPRTSMLGGEEYAGFSYSEDQPVKYSMALILPANRFRFRPPIATQSKVNFSAVKCSKYTRMGTCGIILCNGSCTWILNP
jgi:hypothetical protein